MPWRGTPWLRVNVGTGRPDASGSDGVSIPILLGPEIDQLELIIEALFDWYQCDVTSSAALLADPFGATWDERERFAARELARLGGVVNFLCVMHGVLSNDHKNFASLLKELAPDVFKATSRARDAAIQTIDDDLMGAVTLYRHKVFAHTSYAQPRHRGKTDSRSTQLTSLVPLGGGGSWSRDGFAIGGMAIVSGDEPPLDLPILSMPILRGTFDAVLSAWRVAMVDLLTLLRAVPDAAWERKYAGYQVRVLRDPA